MRTVITKLSACPRLILNAAHYNDDGTCRCQDKTHVEMKRWGYRWDEQQGRWMPKQRSQR